MRLLTALVAMALVATAAWTGYALRTGAAVRPTTYPLATDEFRLSPDGRWLAVASGGQAVLVDVGSGRQHPLTPLAGAGPVTGRFRWNRDGSRLAVAASLAETGWRYLVFDPAAPAAPLLTLDGRHLRWGQEPQTLTLSGADGPLLLDLRAGLTIPLVPMPELQVLFWSPAADLVLLWLPPEQDAPVGSLLAAAVDDPALIRLADGAPPEARVSPAGTAVVYTTAAGTWLYHHPSRQQTALMDAPAAGAWWSPAGDRLALYVDRPAGGARFLTLLTMDGAAVRRVEAPFGAGALVPGHPAVRWSADGSSLAFVVRTQLGPLTWHHLWRLDAASGAGRSRPLGSLAGSPDSALSWAPDASTLFYTVTETKGPRLVRYPLAG